MIFNACFNNLTPSRAPEFATSPLPQQTGITTPVFQSPALPFLQHSPESLIIISVPTFPLAHTTSMLIFKSLDPSAILLSSLHLPFLHANLFHWTPTTSTSVFQSYTLSTLIVLSTRSLNTLPKPPLNTSVPRISFKHCSPLTSHPYSLKIFTSFNTLFGISQKSFISYSTFPSPLH